WGGGAGSARGRATAGRRTARRAGSPPWSGEGSSRARLVPVVDPDLVRGLGVGQVAYEHQGGVSYIQVKRLVAAPAALTRDTTPPAATVPVPAPRPPTPSPRPSPRTRTGRNGWRRSWTRRSGRSGCERRPVHGPGPARAAGPDRRRGPGRVAPYRRRYPPGSRRRRRPGPVRHRRGRLHGTADGDRPPRGLRRPAR